MNRPESSNTAPIVVVVAAIFALVMLVCCGGMVFGFAPFGFFEYIRGTF